MYSIGQWSDLPGQHFFISNPTRYESTRNPRQAQIASPPDGAKS